MEEQKIENIDREPEIIVSLTTTSARINKVDKVIRSILVQTRPADKINLYLSEEAYLRDEGIKSAKIPERLKKLGKEGYMQIIFCENTGPYRKLLPCLKENHQHKCVIITADDDTIYPADWIQRLYRTLRHDPGKIVAYRGHKMGFKDKKLLPYAEWEKGSKEADLLNFATGKDGIIYEPEFFDERVFEKEYMDLSPCNDDIWFKFATYAKGHEVIILGDGSSFPEICPPGKGTLYAINKTENDRQIRKVMEHFGIRQEVMAKGSGNGLKTR